jgi:hypothetical protein
MEVIICLYIIELEIYFPIFNIMIKFGWVLDILSYKYNWMKKEISFKFYF